MSSRLLIFLILLMQLMSLSGNAQEMLNDTLYAGEQYRQAYKKLKNREFQEIDSFIISFTRASDIYLEHKVWDSYLDAQCFLEECYARKGMISETKATALNIIEQSQKHFGDPNAYTGNAWHYLGLGYYYTGSQDSALVYFKRGLDKRLEYWGEESADVALSYNNIAIINMNMMQNDTALAYYLKALEIRKRTLGEKHPDVAVTLHNIAMAYENMYQFELALQYYFLAETLNREISGDTSAVLANNYKGIGTVYWSLGSYDLALEYFKRNMQIAIELYGEDHIEVADSYNNIGFVYKDLNDFENALEYLSKSLNIRKEQLGEDHLNVAISYTNIGNVYNQINMYDLALDYFSRAIRIIKEIFPEENTSSAYIYLQTGIVYENRNELNLALEYYERALQIYLDLLGEMSGEAAAAINYIGSIYLYQNQFDQALEYLNRSLAIYKELLGENNLSVAVISNDLGYAYLSVNNKEKALEYYLSAATIYQEILGGEHTAIADNYLNIGQIYWSEYKDSLAIDYYTRALEIYTGLLGEKHASVANCYNQIGLAYWSTARYSEALRYFHKGVASSIINEIDTADIYSVPRIEEFLNWPYLILLLRAKADILANPELSIDELDEKARFISALRHYQACDTLVSLVRRSINTRSDKISLGEAASDLYENAMDLCNHLREISSAREAQIYNELAFYFSERNKSSVLLEALAGAEAQKFSGIPDTLLNYEQELLVEIADYQAKRAEQSAEVDEGQLRENLFRANRQYDDLISLFETSFPRYFELKYNRKPKEVKDIQQMLDDSTAVLSYFLSDNTITIFTISREKMEIITSPSIDNLADTIRIFRQSLIFPYSPRFNEAYRTIAHSLYKSLLPGNIGNKISKLIIIPDGELSMIPFEALITEKPESDEWSGLPYLLRRYDISYSYSANLLWETFQKDPTTDPEFRSLNDWLAFAPVFDDKLSGAISIRSRGILEEIENEIADSATARRSFLKDGYISPLPGTESEVRSIFRIYDENGKKAMAQIKMSATEDILKSGILQNYKIVHFATHGFVNIVKPELSGILLAQDSTSSQDGVLYTGEIYNLEMDADLAVLSACETGLGEIKKGEGLIGLTRALLYAGTNNIIVSLWGVSDNSTSELMIAFYKNLLASPESLSAYSVPLRQAKLTMIDEGKYAHPFFWSPFILIGK